MIINAGRPVRPAWLTIAFTALLLLGVIGPLASARADASNLVVSLTFDDSTQDQYTNALPALEAHGMLATFYAITGYIGVNPGYLTLPQLQAIYNAGDEIGGHTVLHPNLPRVSNDEAAREICGSRDTLLSWGFPVTSFAYPYSAYNATDEGIVSQCGYNSAREDGNITSPYGCQQGCPLAETIPPRDPDAIRAPQSVQDNWTLADIEGEVTQAESGGGWTVLVFHHVCDNDCNPYSISTANFNALLTWLQTQNVSVETVGQVLGGPVQPAVSAPQVPPAPPGVNAVSNASLETADPYDPGTPSCWSTSTDPSDTASFAETSTAHTGSVGETLTVSSYASGKAELLISEDLGQCAPSAVAGDSYVLSAWYQSTAPTRFVLLYRDVNGGWHNWTRSPQLAPSASWAQATWATPTVPAGATAVSFGLDLESVGTLTTDDYALSDSGGPPGTTSVSLTAPAPGATLTGPVTFTADASSAVGISRVDFLVNGVVVATATSAPYTATWDSTTVGDGPVTLTARATDVGGTKVTTPGQAATVSNAASRGGNMLANGSLETNTGTGTAPDCWQQSSSGTNTATWAYTSTAHTGSHAETVTISAWTSGDRKFLSTQGTSACSPRVTAGSTYALGAWYQGSAPTHFVLYYRNSSGTWTYWTQGPSFAASASWAHAAWITPAVPAGATAVSFGLNLATAGTLTTDDYTMTAS